MTIRTAVISSGGFGSIDASTMGLVTDAVQDPITGAWTGTSQSTTLGTIFAYASSTKRKVYIPSGDYLLTTTVANAVNLSNLHVEGVNGLVRFIVQKTSGSLIRIDGTKDAQTAATIYLTVDADQGTRSITVNDASTLTRGQHISLKDYNQLLYADSTLIAVVGENNQIDDIVGNVVTLQRATEFAYSSTRANTAWAAITSYTIGNIRINSGTAYVANSTHTSGASFATDLAANKWDVWYLGTVIQRYTDPAHNISFRNLTFQWDPTFTYTNTGAIFETRAVTDILWENCNFWGDPLGLPTVNQYGYRNYSLSWTIGATIRGGSSYHYRDAGVYHIILGNETSDIIVDGVRATGGRHFITTGGSENESEIAHVIVSNCIAHGTSLTAYDQHPGARDWSFNNCKASGEGDDGSGLSGAGTSPGFNSRGRRTVINNPMVSSYYYGIEFSIGTKDCVVNGGLIEGCYQGVHIVRAENIKMFGTVFRDIRGTLLDIADMTSTALAPVPNTLLGPLELHGIVEGNPTSLYEIDAGDIGDDWIIDFKAPDATTISTTGLVTTPFVSHDLGTISSSVLTPDLCHGEYQHYTNNGAHTLVPLAKPGRLTLEILNGASASAPVTTLFSAVGGDAYSATSGKKFQAVAETSRSGSRLDYTYMPNPSLMAIATALGLTTNLQLCLDAGDIGSWSGAGDFTDLAGGSPSNFALGAAGAAPTFNGTPGALTANEYWGFDGGDYFVYKTANAAWMQTFHKDSVAAAWAFWVSFGDISTEQCIFGTDGTTGTGIEVGLNSVGNRLLQVRNAGTLAMNQNVASAVNVTETGTWLFLAGIIDEANNTGYIIKNARSATVTMTYSSPAAGNATYLMGLGGAGNGVQRLLSSGAKLLGGWMWTAVKTPADMLAIYSMSRKRLGV